MSSPAEEGVAAGLAEADVCCANCGIKELDDIKLKECTNCDLLKYCGDKCREDHREQHEEECKKRQALLHDRELFTQPDKTHLGECPLCFLPMPLDPTKYAFYSCCCNYICEGCVYAHCRSNKFEFAKAGSCVFCREPMSSGGEEINKRLMKRVKAKDPVAMSQMGRKYHEGGDYKAAFDLLSKAAELGNFHAHYILGIMYEEGQGVEKDEGKEVYHWEKAAIGGHLYARYNLGCNEAKNDNMERSVKHFIIAANLGDELSMKVLWKHFAAGNITKEDLDATLRSNHTAINATQSEQRKAADRVQWKESK
jgi:hypothetical protein